MLRPQWLNVTLLNSARRAELGIERNSMEASSGRPDGKEPKVTLGSKGRFVRERPMYGFRLNDRKGSSFDGQLWDASYVQKEVLVTMLALIRTSHDNRG